MLRRTWLVRLTYGKGSELLGLRTASCPSPVTSRYVGPNDVRTDADKRGTASGCCGEDRYKGERWMAAFLQVEHPQSPFVILRSSAPTFNKQDDVLSRGRYRCFCYAPPCGRQPHPGSRRLLLDGSYTVLPVHSEGEQSQLSSAFMVLTCTFSRPPTPRQLPFWVFSASSFKM